jgi:DNA repair protein NreA
MKSFSGKSQGVHVFTDKSLGVLFGKYNYLLDSRFFLDKKLGFDDILRFRKSVFSGKSKFGFEDKIKETGLSIKPIELDLNVLLKQNSNLSSLSLPAGLSGELKGLEIKENAKVPRFVQRLTDDDLKAEKGSYMLYRRGYDNDYISQLFSTSNLGLLKNRSFVPTRWSITAVDDIIAKNISLKEDSSSDILFFEGEYMSNYFFVLIFPGQFEFELIEKFGENTLSDSEGVFGRKTYAFDTAGGYFASRLGVLEFLEKAKIQGKVLVVRVVKPEYRKSLGVFVVREGVRKVMLFKPIRFNSLSEVQKYAKVYIADMLLKVFPQALTESKIIKDSLNQTNLLKYTSLNGNI